MNFSLQRYMTPGYAFPQRKLWQPIIKGEKKKTNKRYRFKKDRLILIYMSIKRENKGMEKIDKNLKLLKNNNSTLQAKIDSYF